MLLVILTATHLTTYINEFRNHKARTLYFRAPSLPRFESIKCQSSVNQVPIKCQSSANQVSILCQSSVNHVPIKCQSCVNQVPIKCQSSVNQVSIMCQSSVNQVSIKCHCVDVTAYSYLPKIIFCLVKSFISGVP